MAHRQDVHSTYYEQRRFKDGNCVDESKRRKMIRWIKKTIGISDEPRESRQYLEPSGYSRASLSHNSDHGSARQLSHDGHYEQERGVPVYHIGSEPVRIPSNGGHHSYKASMSSTASTISSEGPSIYEYHHRMPQRRKPQPDATQHHNNAPYVLIVGGGIGGLCLAQGLKKHGIPFTVFERDPTPNYRTQGYRLRINNSGYEALKANLSHENFEVFLRSTGHFLPGFMYVDAESGGGAPETVKFAHRSSVTQHVFSSDRAMLRSLLLSDLEEGVEIQFGMAFKRYEIMPNGRVEVHFDNGRVVEGSVLVGADGTTSRVRRQYIPRHVTLLDTDSCAIYGKTPITPEIEQYFATTSTTLVTSQRQKMSVLIEPRCGTQVDIREYIDLTGGRQDPANSELPDLHKYLCWVLLARGDAFHTRPNTTIHDLYAMSPEEVAELSVRMTSSWCPRVRTLFEKQDPEWASFLRISTMSPDIKMWQPSVVTLLGDAAHTMTPAGIGSNTAMQDARILVELFVERGVNVGVIAEYERVMREHGREGIRISMLASQRMFDLPDAKDMAMVVY